MIRRYGSEAARGRTARELRANRHDSATRMLARTGGQAAAFGEIHRHDAETAHLAAGILLAPPISGRGHRGPGGGRLREPGGE